MNINELNKFLEKNPKRDSKYAKFKEEIEYLHSNGATLDSISKFLFQKYNMRKTNSTLHYFIHRNILKKKKEKIKEVFIPVEAKEQKKLNEKQNGNRYVMDTSKRKMAYKIK